MSHAMVYNIYIYIYTYMHTCIHACIHVCVYICRCTHVNMYVQVYVYVYIYICVYIYVYAGEAHMLDKLIFRCTQHHGVARRQLESSRAAGLFPKENIADDFLEEPRACGFR